MIRYRQLTDAELAERDGDKPKPKPKRSVKVSALKRRHHQRIANCDDDENVTDFIVGGGIPLVKKVRHA